MTYTYPTAVRRQRPTGEWAALLANPSFKVLEQIARAAVVCEYVTANAAAALVGITVTAAEGYLELLADLRIVSEPILGDHNRGRAVYIDRSEWAAALTRLRSAPLNTQGAAA